MLGATDTTMYPDAAPAGMVTPMDVLLQELIVNGTAFRVTTLPA
jgi:hypothetical protein